MTLKTEIVEPEETPVAGQRLGKQVSAATDTRAIIEELLGTMFSVRPVQNGYKKRCSVENRQIPCRGGVEYVHGSPVSRRRRQKGKPRM
jgi:hypothetical protein